VTAGDPVTERRRIEYLTIVVIAGALREQRSVYDYALL